MFSENLKFVSPADSARDFVNLGHRMFMYDGVNPNICINGYDKDDRLKSVLPQSEFIQPVTAANGSLTPGATYYYGIRRRITVGSLELKSAMTLSDPVEMDSNQLVCGTAGTTLSGWQGVTDGKFGISLDGETYSVTGVNTAGATNMDDVAASIQTALIDFTNNKYIKVTYSTDHFVFKANVAITVLSEAAGSGTELSVSGYLNGTDGTINEAIKKSAAITIEQYEYLPTSGDSRVTVYYDIFRNKIENNTILYLSIELSQAQLSESVTAWASGQEYVKGDQRKVSDIIYTCTQPHTSSSDNQPESGEYWESSWVRKGTVVYNDITDDLDLNIEYEYSTSESETNNYIPPCCFARPYKGRIVCGGSIPHSFGVAESGSALDIVKIIGDYPVQPVNLGASIVFGDDSLSYQIIAVDLVDNAYKIKPALPSNISNSAYSVFRDFDALYITNPLPGDIESYTTGEIVYPNFDNAEIKGIAAHGGNVFVLRAGGIETIEGGDSTSISLSPLTGTPPPCVSHKSIADDYCKSPYLIYYAGAAGIVIVSDGSFKVISRDISPLLINEVDHRYDRYTHGVYDPVNNRYYLWLFGIGDVETYGLRVPQLMLTYDFEKDSWTKNELAASASGLWKDDTGNDIVVIGIGGGVAKLSDVSYDGMDISGNISSATSLTLTDSSAVFPVASETVQGLIGLPIHIYDSNGNCQRRVIQSNTATVITIFGSFNPVPDNTCKYHIGAIRWNAETGEMAFADSFESRKKFERLVVVGETEEFTAWELNHAYIKGDKIQINNDKTGDTAYICIAPHTSSSVNYPVSGTQWTSCWKELNINVKVSVRACGLERSRITSKTDDLKKQGKIEMSGSALGLRARGASVRFEGDGTDHVTILGINLEATPVNEGK